MVNDTELAPAGIVTVEGTDATPGIEDDKSTCVSTEAGLAIVTVPNKTPPPLIDDLLSDRLLRTNGGLTTSVA